MEKKTSQYRCTHCLKLYKRKHDFEQHMIMCEIMHKTQKEKQNHQEKYNDIPTVKELYDIILQLTKKCNTLETKVEELSKHINTNKKRINITEWLEMHTKENRMISFDEWVNNIEINRGHIEYIFKSDLIEGLIYILKQYLQKHKDNIQLKAFEHKDNILYVYLDKEKKWNQLSYEYLSYIISTLNKKIMGEFVLWQKENKEKMRQEEYSELYINNFQKIIGSKYTAEQIKSKVKRELYNYLKVDLSDMITEYEIS